jgi:dihydromethanopterin reductase (acceptor)
VEINLLKCKGCGACQLACPFDAVTGGRKITIHMRDIDIENTQKLINFPGVEVLARPSDLMNQLDKK